jgi:PTS system mannose-specific IID component
MTDVINEEAAAPVAEKRITKRDLIRSWMLWQIFSHANYNYERLQATGFAHSMTPMIRRLYGESPEETAAALKRHLVFFNTEPNVGAVIHGATIAMEEQRASGKDVTDNAINSVKTGLMGPLAGVGDTITQGTVTPLLLALGIGIAGVSSSGATDDLTGMTGNPLGAIVFLILVSIVIIAMSYFAFTQGYYRGRSFVTSIFKSGLMDKVIVGASVLGNVVLGGLSASFVILFVGPTISVGAQDVSIQRDILDAIMPGLLPLGLVVLTWWLLKRGFHPIKLLIVYLIVSLVAAIPMFGPAPKTVGDACGSSILQPYAPCPAPAADDGSASE